ncbi:MAG: ATP-binding protein [Alphaproteobacteria bacterium]|nr:MAG: ATP-binding protein [Alphaproteobacteria bacterium]
MFKRLLELPKNHSFFLFGPRNTGKTTLIKERFPEAVFIDLLDPEEEEKYMRHPNELKYKVEALHKDQIHIVIDEVQKIPKLLNVVHYLIESTDKHFILTGSSARKLKKDGANLLAGRAFVRYLYPLSFMELQDDFDLNKALSFGLLPKIYQFDRQELYADFLKGYARTYLKEEIWAEHFIKKLDPFRKFLEVAAQMNGKIVNFTKIAADIGVSDQTVRHYFEILEDTLIGFFLEGFKHSVRKRLLERPKFYFFDTGVKRALARNLEIPAQKSTYEYGELFEHFLILECQKLAQYSDKDFRFSYFMTKDGVEIDLVVERPGQCTLFIEMKSKQTVDESDLKELRMISKDFKGGEFVCFSDDSYKKVINGIEVYPWREGIKKYFT